MTTETGRWTDSYTPGFPIPLWVGFLILPQITIYTMHYPMVSLSVDDILSSDDTLSNGNEVYTPWTPSLYGERLPSVSVVNNSQQLVVLGMLPRQSLKSQRTIRLKS